MPKVRLTNENDNDLILSPDSPERSVAKTETKLDNMDAGYTVENFDYHVFSDTTSSIRPNPPSLSAKLLHGRPGIALRQFFAKIRQGNMGTQPKQMFTWTFYAKLSILLLLIISFLLMVVYLGIQGHRLRRESWLRKHQCLSGLCLSVAGAFHSKLNKSISPCANFYQYACGAHFRPHHPTVQPDVPAAQGASLYRGEFDRRVTMHFNREKWRTFLRIHRPAIDHLTEVNIHAIIMGLKNIYYHSSHKESSAKFKIAQWFTSCTNRYYRNWLGARMLINKTVNSLKGLWLFDRHATNETGAGDENSTVNWPTRLFHSQSIDDSTSLPSNWSWMDAIKRLHVDLHVPVFVDFTLRKRTGLPVQIHFVPENSVLIGGTYYKYIEDYFARLLHLLAIEANIPISDPEISSRIQLATKDYIIISKHLFKLLRSTRSKEKTVSLGELNTEGTSFDWKGLLTAYFSEVGYTFTDDFQIHTRNEKFLKRLSPFLDQLQKNFTRPVFNRMLNNYMLCNVLDGFAWHLSYDYVALYDELNSRMDSNLEVDCFMLLHEFFPTVLGAIYVEYHMNTDAVNKTKKTLDTLKRIAHDQIEHTAWLDTQSKRNIEDRIDQMKIKYTIPEIMTDDTKLDYTYRNLKSSFEYVENVLSTIQYSRSAYNRLLAGVAEPYENDWLSEDVYVYDAKIGIHIQQDELYVPLGVLQPPVYHHTLPDAMNFAGFGSMIGSAMAQLIGYLGSYRIEDNYKSLWTEQSWTEYLRHVDCVNYKLRNDTALHLNLSLLLMDFVSNLIEEEATVVINDATGVRIASKSLNRWTLDHTNGIENTTLPGEHFSRDQLFYISYAQTFCDKPTKNDAFYQFYFGDHKVPREVAVNHILAELPEFAATFNCPVGSTMNPSERCSAVL